ncbi:MULTISPECIES: DUF6281 family protein [unclassified Streptomyces]|uniref:DUF6281 family protein n=1 Tax=unclassified Streptomyces TaxID=2593676 RepID=UPI001F51FBD8|nr:DUF6281 family protein [Streptomyces sp. CB02058]
MAAAMVMSGAACTAGGGGDEGLSCAGRYTYQDRTYQDVGGATFTPGKKLGVATQPPCDDTGGQDKSEVPVTTGTAYEVDGIPPEVAIAVGDAPGTATLFAVDSGPDLPPEVRGLIDGS